MNRGMIAVVALLLLPIVAGCAQRSSRDVYQASEVGRTTAASFGTVIDVRQVDITGENTGTGALVGGVAGAGAGSYIGSGSGSVWGGLAGALIGAAAGAAAEQAMADRIGVEYTVVLETGVTLTVVQDVGEGEELLPTGARVMVQNSGGYQRVLPASHLPTQIQRPKGIKVVD